MHPVRNSVKALIVRNDKLLCIRKADEKGYYYVLPGGGQEKDETFVETIIRECREEVGAKVEVGRLKYIREYIGKNHEFRETDKEHQVEFMFECSLLEEPDMLNASHLDEGQNGIEWVDFTGQQRPRVYPKILVDRLRNRYPEVYWGDVN